MTTIKIPPAWATLANYSTGGDTGTPTKVDPASSANGFVRGTVAAPQHVNFLFNAMASIVRRAFSALLIPRVIDHEFGTSSSTMAAVHIENGGFSEGIGTLVLKPGTDGVALVKDGGIVTAATDLTGTHSLVTSAAHEVGADRIVVVHTGGSNNQFTDDMGATWTAGGAVGFVPQDVVWNDALSLFLCNSASGSSVARSADATSWTGASHSLATNGNGGIAVLASGRTVICGNDGGSFPRFSISDNGSVWSDSGGFPADGGISFANAGYICGNGGPVVWHVGFRGSAFMRVSTSPDGVTWTTVADFSTAANSIPPAAVQPTIQPRIMCCQNTGLLVIVGCDASNTNTFAVASADGGVTWSDPIFFTEATNQSFAVASGKLFHTEDVRVEMSDGIGWRG